MAIAEEMLTAFVDDELDAEGRARVAQALLTDPGLRARLEAHRRLKARLADHYGPVAQEEVPDRLATLLRQPPEQQEKVVPIEAARRRPLWTNAAAMAATLVLGLVAGLMVPRGSGPVTVEEGVMVARGDLAEALDTQLASAQVNAPTRIGITFPATDGRLCRTFDGAAISGLACRGDDRWEVMMTAPGSGAGGGDYRQAASGNLLVLETAQEMMAGEPLDAQTERRAQESGWRNNPAGD